MSSFLMRRFANPPTGIVVILSRALEDVPAGARAVLIGSMFRYDRVSPSDCFEIEYEGRAVTVRRDDLE